MNTNNRTLWIAQVSIFTAVELIFCFTPLGSLPVTPGIVATLAHLPAIVAALALGYSAAAILGGVMGFSALIIWTFMPPNPIIAFVFSPAYPGGNVFSALISVVPRILFPLVTVYLYRLSRKKLSLIPSAVIAAAGGTLAHSAMVLSAIYLVFHGNEVVGGDFINFIIAWGGVNALMEIVVAVVAAAGVIIPLSKLNNRGKEAL